MPTRLFNTNDVMQMLGSAITEAVRMSNWIIIIEKEKDIENACNTHYLTKILFYSRIVGVLCGVEEALRNVQNNTTSEHNSAQSSVNIRIDHAARHVRCSEKIHLELGGKEISNKNKHNGIVGKIKMWNLYQMLLMMNEIIKSKYSMKNEQQQIATTDARDNEIPNEK